MTPDHELRHRAPSIEGLGRYDFGWPDSDTAGANARRGLSEDVVRNISALKSEPQWMLDLRLKGLRLFGKKPMPTWGCRPRRASTSTTSSTSCGPRRSRPTSWDELPADIKNTYDRLGIPEAEKQRLDRRRRRAVRVRGRLPPDPRGPGGAGRHLPRHRHRPARARGPVPRVLRHGHPGRRQQVRRAEHRGVVRRLVHLRAEGRARRHPAAGLLPDQHREHGPVRADADHRRRGLLRALRRGLHRADLLVRLAALRGRRDHRQEGRPGAATRRSRTGRTTSTTWSPSGPPRPRARRWSGSTATSAPRSR